MLTRLRRPGHGSSLEFLQGTLETDDEGIGGRLVVALAPHLASPHEGEEHDLGSPHMETDLVDAASRS